MQTGTRRQFLERLGQIGTAYALEAGAPARSGPAPEGTPLDGDPPRASTMSRPSDIQPLVYPPDMFPIMPWDRLHGWKVRYLDATRNALRRREIHNFYPLCFRCSRALFDDILRRICRPAASGQCQGTQHETNQHRHDVAHGLLHSVVMTVNSNTPATPPGHAP